LHKPGWIMSKMCGPSGWNQEIMKVLNNE